MASQKVLIYGGKGALGSVLVNYFKSKNWWVASLDLVQNEEAHANITIKNVASWTEQEQEIITAVEETLKGEKLDAILCVAGGWAGGNAASKDLVKNCDLMWKQSVWSSVLAAEIASKHLKDGGLLQLTGAQPALNGTAGMLGYGMAKAAVHQFVKGLGSANSGLPAKSTALAILPVTLDTPNNRKWMANADFTSWTTLEYVADLLHQWSTGQNRPDSGSLVQLVTKDSKTEQIIC
ncbi:dihydropteridine reductase-like [Anneissia japonica]|uniref:dihydropteridine reductase-like n=1 Tax=Anneissia japonica TaxID=1529436 RepID=UPI001425543F|nr:dihydropteridine reductase-like [Anneissia japonica]